MKVLIVSDLHGSYFYATKVIELWKQHQADKLLFLGDALYHGPRNPLPKEYNPAKVCELLNPYRDNIIAVRGNCDSEVDQMVLDFDVLETYTTLYINGKSIFATHGHIYHPQHLPKGQYDYFMYGHTHLLQLEQQGTLTLYNPGSISMPKGGNPSTYGLLSEDGLYIYDLDGHIVKQQRFK